MGRPLSLVTGAAGFIGYHVTKRLLERGDHVIGIDDLNAYYDVKLKEARLSNLLAYPHFQFERFDIAERASTSSLFQRNDIRRVIHLAAQAGVRHSLLDPYAYVDSNISGFLNILEGCRRAQVEHLVFASSSSVYGANTRMPFSVEDNVDHPVSLYAATKKANELMAHSYAHLYGIPCTGLRFFTVYGPWGRPDMALFIFTRAILNNEPLDVFNFGKMKRDFTYIDDAVEAVLRVLEMPAKAEPNAPGVALSPSRSFAAYRLYNIGNHQSVELLRVIGILEDILHKQAKKNFLPIQPGDVPATYANVDDLIQAVGFKPDTPIELGIQRFVQWFREYYKI